MFVRSLRIIGIFLSTVAVFFAFNWFLNTLMPLNRLNGLQPTKAELFIQAAPGSMGLLECYMSPNWTENSSGILLDCDGNEMQVQKSPSDIKNLSAKVTAPGEKKTIATSDPVVVVGKLASDRLGKDRLGKDRLGKDSNASNAGHAIEAELLAYGNRSTNLSAFQASGVLQIIAAEIVGLFGILLLFLDWRITRSRRARRTREALQVEKSYAFSKDHLIEKPFPNPRR
jgi:hypothetical protein